MDYAALLKKVRTTVSKWAKKVAEKTEQVEEKAHEKLDQIEEKIEKDEHGTPIQPRPESDS